MSALRRSIASTPAGPLEITVTAATHTGLVRSANEDSFLAEGAVFVVADGMGGHERGEVASRSAITVLREGLRLDAPNTPVALLAAIDDANSTVRALSATTDVGTRVAGTTLAGVALVDAGDPNRLYWMAFNVGDSRVYTWDGRKLEQLSVDHSAVQELIDAGAISVADAASHPDRNIITRALGAEVDVDADVWLLPVSGHQGFLICSDGLTKDVGDERIAAALAEHADAAEALVELALSAGGRDNVTVVIVEAVAAEGVDAVETTQDRDGLAEGTDEDTTPRLVRGT
ncbi:protein phosphatase 2C domain-containing protein [Rathayibacter sp. YIM 133350]|uniref:PP2C family protein-serine/threonine phosphatase n=1 Tax=Rathayibacter sp. YIM 133350 TaxID=3131992 RepID=UPI00307CFA27